MIEKIASESGKAYQSLLDYWNMGASRSITKLVELYMASPSPPTTRYSTVAGWSSRYNWKERIEAEIIAIAKQNESVAIEERAKLFNKQFDLIYDALEVAETAKQSINFEKTSVAQFTGILTAIHKMLADLRTNDTTKVALTDVDGKKPYEGKVDESTILAIAARFDKANE